jgi:hypothetical protein
MNKSQWVLGCFVVLLIGCTDENKQTSVTTHNKLSTESGIYKQTPTATETEKRHKPDYTSKTPGYLEQNWDHEKRMEWYYTSQGSRLLPYDWFIALEQPDSEKLVSSKEKLEQYRFVA